MKGVSFVSEAIKGTNRLVQKSCKRAMNNTFLDHPESLFGISTSLRRMHKKAQFCYLFINSTHFKVRSLLIVRALANFTPTKQLWQIAVIVLAEHSHVIPVY